jgi:hypothetical protein
MPPPTVTSMRRILSLLPAATILSMAVGCDYPISSTIQVKIEESIQVSGQPSDPWDTPLTKAIDLAARQAGFEPPSLNKGPKADERNYYKGIVSLALRMEKPNNLVIRIHQFGPPRKTSEYLQIEKALTTLLSKELHNPKCKFTQSAT